VEEPTLDFILKQNCVLRGVRQVTYVPGWVSGKVHGPVPAGQCKLCHKNACATRRFDRGKVTSQQPLHHR